MSEHTKFPPPPPLPRQVASYMSDGYSVKRSPKDGAWFWGNKSAMEKIRHSCERAKLVLGVYVALCEIASDEHSDDFIASTDKIASRCGQSYSNTFELIKELERIGLVRVLRSPTNQNFRVPSAYTLLKCEYNPFSS